MEKKKSKNVDLEKRTPFFIQIGLIVALSIVLVAFEWTKGEGNDNNMEVVQEMMMILNFVVANIIIILDY